MIAPRPDAILLMASRAPHRGARRHRAVQAAGAPTLGEGFDTLFAVHAAPEHDFTVEPWPGDRPA
jgi:hypothetical protein